MKSVFSAVLSYGLFVFLILFSLLPLPILYLIGDILAIILYYLLGYRKKVVFKNLRSSLPPGADIGKTARRFYRYLAEITMESIRFFTISKKSLLRKISYENPELMEQLASQHRSVIVMSGHYGNWELLIYAMNLLFPHLAVGVGKPLTNKTLNRLLNARRARFGMKIISAQNIRESFREDRNILTASLFLSDQFPGHNKKGYDTIFLGKPTRFMYGAEKYAVEYNFPVVYADLQRLSRRHYALKLTLLSENPASSAYGEIMGNYVQCLNKAIEREPAYWLWSHKRWKQIPGFYLGERDALQ